MPTVASLDVLLSADVSKFAAGLGVAGQKLTAFKAGPIALAVEAVQALGRTFASVVEEMDAAGDKAANLGVAVDELTRLHFAAEKLGGSSESLDRALTELQKRMPDIALNTGDAAKAIQRLGLDTAKFSSLDPATAFRTVVKATEGLESQTEKVMVAYDLFGKSAKELFSTLTAGEKTLDEQRRLSDELGNTILETESAAADAAKNGLADLAAAWSGIKQELIALAPAAADALKWLADYMNKVRYATGLTIAFLPGGETPIEFTARRHKEDMDAKFQPPGMKGQTTKDMFALIERQRMAEDKAAKELAEQQQQLADQVAREAEMAAEKAADAAAKEMDRQQRAQREAIDKMIEAQQELADSARDVWEQTRSPAEAAALEIDRLNGLFVQGYLSADTFARRLEQMHDEFAEPAGSAAVSAGAALEAGSSAAISAAIEAGSTRDKQDVPQKQLIEQQRSRELLERIARGFEELTGDTISLGAT